MTMNRGSSSVGGSQCFVDRTITDPIVHAVPGTALPGGPGRRAPARGLSSTDMPTAGLHGTYSMVDHEVVTEETAYGDLKEDPMWATDISKLVR